MLDFMRHDFTVSSIVVACHVAKGAGQAYHRDRPSHGLALHLEGDKDYVFSDGRRVHVEKNTLAYLPKDSTYRVEIKERGACYAINFELLETVDFKPFSVRVRDADRVLDLFKSATRKWNARGHGYQMACKAELYRILCILQAEAAQAYAPQTRLDVIAQALVEIRTRYTEVPLQIAELAALCGITPEYFRRIFRQQFGTSPCAFINRLKLTHAKELLDSGLYSISEAASASGFSDMTQFSRAFRKEYGVSAREYLSQK